MSEEERVVRDSRLVYELEEMKRLTRESSMIGFEANDEYQPDQYYVKFQVTGLVHRDRRSNRHVAHIYLSASYPRNPPVVRFKTPIFHPNIKALLDDDQQVARFAANVGGQENLERLYYQNPGVRELFDAHICLDVLDLNWTPSVTLYDICLELGAMIQYQRYNLKSPLNHEAAEWTGWAEAQPGLLPIDTRDLRDRLQLPTAKEVGRTPIRIVNVEKVAP